MEITQFEREIGELIIECLNLEDITIEDIDPNGALFNDGLGLDSIDALELSMALAENYGVNLESDNPNNKRIFSSLSALSNHVQNSRKN